MPTTIAILAGGKSRRFGSDKAALFLPGMVKACLATGRPTIVVGRESQEDVPSGVRFYQDELAERGPLGGLVTALRAADGPVLALACDLPALRPAALDWLLDFWNNLPTPVEVLIASTTGGDDGVLRLQPLFAVYAPACLPVAEKRLADGRGSLHGLVESCAHQVAPLPEILVPQLRNVNTPSDLAPPPC